MSSRRLTTLVALCVLVLGTVAVLAVAALPGPRRVPPRAVVPVQFPGYSSLTSSLAADPVGAAVAVYRQEAVRGVRGSTQTLLLGADGRSARRLVEAGERGGSRAPAAVVLSPDGRTVAVGDGPWAGAPGDAPAPAALPPGRRAVVPRTPAPASTPATGGTTGPRSTLALVDLSTGASRVHVVPRVPTVVPVSWSGDGSRLAYLGTDAGGGSEAGADAAPATGQLFVLDTGTGRAAAVPGAEEVLAAALSPDGTRLAFQAPDRPVVRVVDPFADPFDDPFTDAGRGRGEGVELAVPAGAVLAGGPAWSPDGSLLALTTGTGTPGARIAFVATRPGGDVPAAVPGAGVLGWASPRALLHRPVPAQQDRDADLVVLRTDLGTGARSAHLRVPTARGHHRAGDLTLAGGLLPGAVPTTSRAVDRGPWPLPARLGLVLAGAVLAVPATAGLLRQRDRLAALTAVPEWARDPSRG
ncbi:hypothetical protein AB2L27_19020 [Kineococcus sp. LSe6-4]|uniref:WD40 repeat protein n=1 Tax=Kineococcus halophytocola TaxID=3234027 RepID=A0ABV4H8W8_9ACTN